MIMSKTNQKFNFSRIEKEHENLKVLSQSKLFLNNEDLLKKAKDLLENICESGTIVRDDYHRSLLRSYATYWADKIYDLERISNPRISPPSRSLGKLNEDEAINYEISNRSYVENNTFFGREDEVKGLLKRLTALPNELIQVPEIKTEFDDPVSQRHTLLTIVGAGGLGKTALTNKLIQAPEIKGKFGDRIVWRYLKSAPYFNDFLSYLDQELVKKLEESGSKKVERKLSEDKISDLIALLKIEPCLIILDNFEEIERELARDLSSPEHYKKHYAQYSKFLQQIILSTHKSSVIVTSRDPISSIDSLRQNDKSSLSRSQFYSLNLELLPWETALKILDANGLASIEKNIKEQIYKKYPGNPLDLKIVAKTIIEDFGGHTEEFLNSKDLEPGLYGIFLKRFNELSSRHQKILYKLAINQVLISDERDPIVKEEIEAVKNEHELWFENTERKSILALRAELSEFVIKSLLDKLVAEITNIDLEKPSLEILESIPLLNVWAEGRVRLNQREFILIPLIDRLIKSQKSLEESKKNQVENKLKEILKLLKDKDDKKFFYGAGNILNLLIILSTEFKKLEEADLSNEEADLSSIDCSGLKICQVDFHRVILHNANFENCEFKNCRFKQSFSTPLTVAFHPKRNDVVIGNASGKVVSFEFQAKDYKTFTSHTNRVRKVIFSQDGKFLASTGDDKEIKIYDLDNSQNQITLSSESMHSQPIWSIAFSKDNEYIASASEDCSIKIWKRDQNQYKYEVDLNGHTHRVWEVSFHPDGKILATVSRDSSIRLWDLELKQLKQVIRNESESSLNGMRCVQYSPDGKWLAAGDEQGNVKLWKISGEEYKSHDLIGSHNGKAVLSVTFSPDSNYLASSSDDESIQVWKKNENDVWKFQYRLWKHIAKVWSTSFSHDNKYLVSCSDDQTVRFWDVKYGSYLYKLQGFSTKVLAVAFHPDGSSIASAHEDQIIRTWNIGSTESTESNKYKEHRGWVWSLAYNSSGTLLVSSSDDETIKIWDTKTHKRINKIDNYPDLMEGHTGWVRSVCFSPDDKFIASGSDDCTVKIWEVDKLGNKQQGLLKTLKLHKSLVNSVHFNQNGELLASASNDKTVLIWRCSTDGYKYDDKPAHTLNHDDYVMSVRFHPTNPMQLVTGCKDGQIFVWDLNESLEPPLCKQQACHGKGVWSVVFSPDGKLLASCGDDETIKIWNINSMELVDTLEGHTSRVRSVAFSKNGEWLASGSEDETIRLWKKIGNTYKLSKEGFKQSALPSRIGELGFISIPHKITLPWCNWCNAKQLRAERPYEGLKISGISGLSDKEKENLKGLGAIDNY